jgi:hypothetical protein
VVVVTACVEVGIVDVLPEDSQPIPVVHEGQGYLRLNLAFALMLGWRESLLAGFLFLDGIALEIRALFVDDAVKLGKQLFEIDANILPF